ncbi:MAG: endonuclease/exonuclease/phosphatase family protein [Acidimicrobiia bacterium]
MRKSVIGGLMAALMVVFTVAPAVAAPRDEVRFATFNASLNRFNEGELVAELQAAVAGSVSDQVAAVLEIVALNDADVLLINEFDFDPEAGALFAELTGYRHHFIAPSNTGVPSGFDLDNSGAVEGPNDAFGFGFFPGQFGMLVLSRYPILERRARTFQNFLWKDMPGALLPVDPSTGESWYSDDELAVFRLSSKSHWDLPIRIGRRTVHFLVSHPTPPVFDGAEDRNGTRNSDEIRFWADYVSSRATSRYIYDDRGQRGGLNPGSFFVVAGDLNSDPFDGDSIPGAAQQLLDHPRVNTSVTPSSEGAVEASAIQGGANDSHIGDPRFDTADFADGAPGNLRVDYVLPSKALRITDAGVFWPVQADPLFPLVGVFPFPSSDHRMVWVDVRVPGLR